MTIHPAKKPKPRSSGASRGMKRSRLRPKNVKRRKSEFQRAYGSEARVEFVKSLPCIVGCCLGLIPVENAHIETGGMGRKADYTLIVPLCTAHHKMAHDHGHERLAQRYGIDLKAAAAETECRWLYHSNRNPE
jgi:hypothetical protein